MARSGSDKRQRTVTLKFRATEAEAASLKAQADRAGVPLAALLRFRSLDDAKVLPSCRIPPLGRKFASQFLGKLGHVSANLQEAALSPECSALVIEACHQELCDMRVELFKALGREP